MRIPFPYEREHPARPAALAPRPKPADNPDSAGAASGRRTAILLRQPPQSWYRRLSGGVAGELAFTLQLLDQAQTPQQHRWVTDTARHEFDLRMRFEPGAQLAETARVNVLGPMDDDLQAALAEKLTDPFTMDWTYDPQSVLIWVQLKDGVLDVLAPRKRLDLGTLLLFVAWLLGTSLLLFGIAALFMRNQVRGIRRLAEAVEAFGMGRDPGPIRPEGASELRAPAPPSTGCKSEVRRFLVQRTEMLAGVSHELRTPLTRMRLALAMLPPDEDIRELASDVHEMERMIEGYLAFARGEGTEQAEAANLSEVLEEVAGAAKRARAPTSRSTCRQNSA